MPTTCASNGPRWSRSSGCHQPPLRSASSPMPSVIRGLGGRAAPADPPPARPLGRDRPVVVHRRQAVTRISGKRYCRPDARAEQFRADLNPRPLLRQPARCRAAAASDATACWESGPALPDVARQRAAGTASPMPVTRCVDGWNAIWFGGCSGLRLRALLVRRRGCGTRRDPCHRRE
jgi:hypothetical protein